MFLKQPDLTSGSRPILQQDETLLFVQNGVGLYEGKFKIASCQNGHAYLTSHRACYIDDVEPRKNSLTIDLRDVERHEYQAGFLRSSAKVTLHPKPMKRVFGPAPSHSPLSTSVQRLQGSQPSPISRSASPFLQSSVAGTTPTHYTGNWICPICTFHNPVPPNFDPSNENFLLAPCLTCGIKPPFSVVLKAAIQASTNRPVATPTTDSVTQDTVAMPGTGDPDGGNNICPRCTFNNHVSIRYCEVCGSLLPSNRLSALQDNHGGHSRIGSPGPEIARLSIKENEEIQSVKFSFRLGGDKVFYDRLKSALIQRKWLVANAPPAPSPLDNLQLSEGSSSGPSTPDRTSTPRPVATRVGIAGLEQRGLQSRRNNEAVLGTAFEDLEALMASAREVVALAERFSRDSQGSATDPLLSESAAAMGMVATKDMLSDTTNKLYINELSRNLAEYVTDERRAILRRQGGTMSLVDLWATFNRSRNGVELISPSDFHKAAEMWTSLGLPVRLRSFKSGLLVVQRSDQNDEKTIAQLQKWFERIRLAPVDGSAWDWLSYASGVTAQDAARELGWSLGVATEELEMAEERGILCREEGIQGLKFWLNYLVDE